MLVFTHCSDQDATRKVIVTFIRQEAERHERSSKHMGTKRDQALDMRAANTLRNVAYEIEQAVLETAEIKLQREE